MDVNTVITITWTHAQELPKKEEEPLLLSASSAQVLLTYRMYEDNDVARSLC